MSQTVRDKITVAELSKYGVKVGNEYVNFSKNLKEADKGLIVPGAALDVELFVSDSGKRYINTVFSSSFSAPKTAKAETPKVPPKTETKATSATMTKEEWKEKDRSQLIGGLSHDAAMLVAAMITVFGNITSTTEAIALHKDVLQGLLNTREVLK